MINKIVESNRAIVRCLACGVIAASIVTGVVHASGAIQLPVRWAVYPGMSLVTACGLFLGGCALLVISRSTKIKE